MARISGIASLLIFVVSAALHLATYIPDVPVNMELAWPLHLAAMAVFGILIIHLRQQRRPHKSRAKGLFGNWRTAAQQDRALLSELVGLVPRWLLFACLATFIHPFVNFAMFILLMEGGSSVVEGGKFILQEHGRKIRDLTKQEFERFRAYELRGFSGHWMVFSIIPATYFLAVQPKLKGTMELDIEKGG